MPVQAAVSGCEYESRPIWGIASRPVLCREDPTVRRCRKRNGTVCTRAADRQGDVLPGFATVDRPAYPGRAMLAALVASVVRKATVGLSESDSLALLPGLRGARVPSDTGGPPSVTVCQCWPSSTVVNNTYDSPCMAAWSDAARSAEAANVAAGPSAACLGFHS